MRCRMLLAGVVSEVTVFRTMRNTVDSETGDGKPTFPALIRRRARTVSRSRQAGMSVEKPRDGAARHTYVSFLLDAGAKPLFAARTPWTR